MLKADTNWVMWSSLWYKIRLNERSELAFESIKLTNVEVGAGTGRITLRLLPYVRHIYAFDLTPAMVDLAHRTLRRFESPNCSIAIADSRAVPFAASSADIAIEGWSFMQIMTWHMEGWQQEVGQAIKEMLRILRPGGMVILVETLGSGETIPNPPARFQPTYEYSEHEWQFSSRWIRANYCFSPISQAAVWKRNNEDVVAQIIELLS